MIRLVGPEVEGRLDWLELTEALAEGHRRPRAELAETFLRRGEDTLQTRSAVIDGLGAMVKSFTVFPGNAGRGAADGQRRGGALRGRRRDAGGDGRLPLLTRWKTAGDACSPRAGWRRRGSGAS